MSLLTVTFEFKLIKVFLNFSRTYFVSHVKMKYHSVLYSDIQRLVSFFLSVGYL